MSYDAEPSPSLDGRHLEDERDLAELGHEQALTRKFGLMSMFFLAFSVLGTWSTFAQDLASGLNNGASITIFWGLCLVTVCNLCVALSLGELCSSMPTALGQAYWVHRLLPGSVGRFLSYICAWINTFGWWTLTASQLAFMTNFMLGMELIFDSDWAPASTGWVQFLVYLGATLLVTVVNLVACRKDWILPQYNNFVGICFTALFFVFVLALPISVRVKPGLAYQPASFVFGTWINETGWSDGVVFFLGLVQAAYGLTAFDSAVHMTEEIPRPRKNVPRVMWMSVAVGASSGFIFLVACMFTIQSLDDLLDPPSGNPFVELVVETIGERGGAALLALFIFNGMGQAVSIATTASRLTWGFARDGGLPWSGYFAQVNGTWRVPVRALCLQGVLIGILGVLYTFASTVLQAILSVSTIALTISYCMPIVALLVAGRSKLPPGGHSLGRWGPLLNWVSVVYCVITTVFFFFPASPDPSVSDMNYAIAVFGVMMVIALFFWVIEGRNVYLQIEDAQERVIHARQLQFATAAEQDLKSEDKAV